MPTQNEYNVSTQICRNLYAKINLLNYKFQIVDEWSNVVVGNPTFTENANSDIRRTCDIALTPTDDSFSISDGNKIWLDKYIQIYLGIEDILTGEIVYTNMGIYLINNPSQVWSAVDNTITISGLDLMAKLTGLRNGNLEGLEHIIPQGSNVRDAIIATLELAGFTNYIVSECPVTVQNDINIDVSGTVFDILKQLRDILPQYQMYFDVDGVFHYELIPSGNNEQIMIDDDVWTESFISYDVNTDFESLKNSITVIGKTHDIKNYGGTATISTDTYVITISTVSALRDNLKVGFVAPSKLTAPKLNLNSYGAKNILNEDGTVPILSDDANVYYVVKYQTTGDYWLFMGEVTPTGYVEDDNVDSPFYVNGTVGKIRIVLSGGDYDNIYTSDLAQQRAEYELYLRCRLLDNITIQCVPIYWAQVNWLIEITLPSSGETVKYITKQINTTYGETGTQSITAMKYYPFYEV